MAVTGMAVTGDFLLTSALPVSDDRILGGRLLIRQPRDGYRAAIDPVLLAAAIPATGGETVLDLGCGVGTAGLCVAARLSESIVSGIDVQPALVALAQSNARENALAARVTFSLGDVLAGIAKPYHHVLANPPYLERARASISPNAIKAIANVEGAARLKDWVTAAMAAVLPGGSVTFIHRADRAVELRHLMAAGLGRVYQLALLPKASAPPKRILMQGVMGAPPSFQELAPFVLHEMDGAFTSAADAILRGAEMLPMVPSR